MEQVDFLGPISELVVTSTASESKNVFWTSVETRGHLDEEAFKTAVARVSESSQQLTSRIWVVRKGLRHLLARQYTPGSTVPIFFSDLSEAWKNESSFTRIVRHLSPRLDRDWNLFEESPSEIHVLQLNEDHHLLVLAVHHVVGDVSVAVTALRDILGRYHAITTGVEPEWLSFPYAVSSARKQESTPGKSAIKDMVSGARRERAYRKGRPVRPLGTGDRQDTGENHSKIVLSAELTAAIKEQLARDGLRLVDHVLACSNVALDEWNEAGNMAKGTITSAITVNMRGRFGGEDVKNYSSVIFFSSRPDDRKDYQELAAMIAQERAYSFKRQMDRRLRGSITKGASLLSFFPLWVKRKVARMALPNNKYSIHVGYVGVVFPDASHGHILEGQSFSRAGDLDIIETHGAGHKLAGRCHINLMAYIFRNKLNLVLFTSSALLTAKENDDFLDLIADNLGKRISRDEPDLAHTL
jgi:Condensation domain